jgi:ketol-acid reductoisomerase
VDNIELIAVNGDIRYTVVEKVGEELRSHMSAMKPII